MDVTKFVVLLVLALFVAQGEGVTKVFNMKDYGAVEGGQVDSSQALLRAWSDACKSKGGSRLVISKTYLVNPVVLLGPCLGPIEFQHSGSLKSPLGLRGESWFEFRHVDGLSLFGGGQFDGQVSPEQPGPNRPALLRFSFVNDTTVENVKLMNSQSTHFHLFGCERVTINRIQVSSPGDSPNTDGIKIGSSNNITILDTTIASGDDCVAIIRGSSNITVNGVVCGPGHGISIGSIGSKQNERVEQVVVQNCRFVNTTNGLRIKTFANDTPGVVVNVLYEGITLDYVYNPILIDQNYCPPKTCAKGHSGVRISDVKFRNIHGTSLTDAAVNLQCSGSHPCEGIDMRDIDIRYVKGDSISKCSNVRGQAFGQEWPKPCNSLIAH